MTQRFENLPEKEIYANPPLRAYLTNVQRRHRYVRLQGLPNRDRPNLPIELMFVHPLVSPRPISLDSNANDWMPQRESVYAALERYRRLLLLGDPGIGKTTLFNRLARDLTFAPSSGPFVKRFGWVLPVPMVLRGLPLGSATTFDGLLNAFLSQPVGEPLRDGDYLCSMLQEGRVLLLLDGIDELGSKEARLHLRAAVFDGMRRYPDCLWLLSSRIVGYGEAAFEGKQLAEPGQEGNNTTDPDAPLIGKRYIAPFDMRRIRRFVHNWYALRDADAHKEGRAVDLVSAIRRDESLRRLARTPNILALMALVHRMEAILPHQRSVLYQRIAEAYLESIDKHKGIGESALDLPHKRMWLSRVGYEMQCRREHGADGDLLVSCDDVLHWIDNEMGRSKAFGDLPTPAEFLSFVGGRSGLFIPRGNDQYAFSHLSFQEYFAAVALEGEVTGFKWVKEGRSSLEFNAADVVAWAGQPAWLETFCFLFELLADRPEWHSELLNCVFGDSFSSLYEIDVSDELFNLGYLAARLAVNPYSGLSEKERAEAIDSCVSAQIRYSDYALGSSASIFGILLCGDAHFCHQVMASIRKQWPAITENLDFKVVDFRRADHIDLCEIAKLGGVEALFLSETNVRDVAPIAELKSLYRLDLDNTPISDITPISSLRSLEVLDLDGTEVDDISCLRNLPNLGLLLLSDTPVSEDAVADLEEALPNCEIIKER